MLLSVIRSGERLTHSEDAAVSANLQELNKALAALTDGGPA
jgi:hypothetical protein